MTPGRFADIPGFGIDRVAAAAGTDPEVLRLENLDTDLAPPAEAVRATRAAVGEDEHNSYLPFIGRLDLRQAIADRLERSTGRPYDPATEVVVTAGGTAGMLAALLALTDPGDEVVLDDPIYAGMTNRVRLVGATPRLVPLLQGADGWQLDARALGAAVTARTRLLFLMSPSMPSGAVLGAEDWAAVARLCAEHDLTLLYNAAMERIVFDGRAVCHPGALEGLAERTVTVGSVSKEYRMIGWRIGWVAGPAALVSNVARAAMYTVVTPPGIGQPGAVAALHSPPDELTACVEEWQRRRDVALAELEGLPAVPPHGGWSLLLDVHALGHDSVTASRRLLERGRIAATPMRDWGEVHGDRFVRLVYSNEPIERLHGLGARVRSALL